MPRTILNYDRTDSGRASAELSKHRAVLVHFTNHRQHVPDEFCIVGRVIALPFFNESGEHCIAIEQHSGAVAGGLLVRVIPLKWIDRIEVNA